MARTCRLRLVLAVVATAAATAASAPSVAYADWGWWGWLPHSSNGACSWYVYQATCSPYSTSWYGNVIWNKPTSVETAHGGFENYSAIRGMYLFPDTASTVYVAGMFGTGSNVQGEMTCGDNYDLGACPESYGANVSFTVTV